MTEHVAELDNYNAGYGSRQNTDKPDPRSVIKWSETAYRKYEWQLKRPNLRESVEDTKNAASKALLAASRFSTDKRLQHDGKHQGHCTQHC